MKRHQNNLESTIPTLKHKPLTSIKEFKANRSVSQRSSKSPVKRYRLKRSKYQRTKHKNTEYIYIYIYITKQKQQTQQTQKLKTKKIYI